MYKRVARKLKLMFVKHSPTGVLHVAAVYEKPTPAELETAGNAYGEPKHVLRKGKISAKRRRRGIWQYDPDNRKWIYFTCPWCGAIGRTTSSNVKRNCHESIFCGRTSPSSECYDEEKRVKGCGRHLSLYYLDKPKPMQSINDDVF